MESKNLKQPKSNEIISSVLFNNTFNFGVDDILFSKFLICLAKSSFRGFFKFFL